MVVIRPKADPDQFIIEKLADDEWVVRGDTIERIAGQTYFEIDAAAIRFQRILDRMGVNKALTDAGVQNGDMVWFGAIELEWQSEE
ncbi:MAG: Obg family GTPase CgtA [Candidatus Promineifilaceae bacterium]